MLQYTQYHDTYDPYIPPCEFRIVRRGAATHLLVLLMLLAVAVLARRLRHQL